MVKFEKEKVTVTKLDFNEEIGELIKGTEEAYGKGVPISSSKEIKIGYKDRVYEIKLKCNRIKGHKCHAKLRGD